ncbi:hypothetical protein Amsp01_081840 [Amycolatopsis sp. NBRC 101858]|uniref:hypothetical protein n=1 Tax=Amycolatopsis sp. NBRC 101858 TaxID=3032200 RepID=UPI0024A5B98E|nr:hypothetical protein [Amycolatopsis sp. NBRC 101858]GLY42161.1 hypothetical protein Amsp01_081840 [Amycolatopsis sp. NBRC 101858]
MSKEGFYTRLGAVAAVIALVPAYLAVAGDQHWPPFPPVPGAAQPAPPGTSRTEPARSAPAPDDAEEDLAGFVVGYYRSMPDTSAGWPLIGPNLRGRGRASYDRFWGRYRSAEVLDQPSVRDSQVTVRIALHPRDGTATLVERHVLTVIHYDGGLRIDADEYLGLG